MKNSKDLLKVGLLVGLLAGIVVLHGTTVPGKGHHHAVYRMLFYLPLLLGVFWYGLRGAFLVCAGVFLPYGLLILARGPEFPPIGVERLLEGLLFAATAGIVGFLVERERRRQRVLRDTESLAAVGRAMSEIAHDMKGPLMAIGGFAGQVARRLDPGSKEQEKLRIIIQETARLQSMVQDMLSFGGPASLRLQVSAPEAVVQESIRLAGEAAEKAGVGIVVEIEGGPPPVEVDPPKIVRALVNLVLNAIHASKRGQSVRVRLSETSRGACFEVIDSGAGVPDEDAERIFQPFFSTKGEGTGLGLAIVKKIIEAHSGTVSYHPNPAAGSTFGFTLPGKDSPGFEKECVHPGPPGGGRRMRKVQTAALAGLWLVTMTGGNAALSFAGDRNLDAYLENADLANGKSIYVYGAALGGHRIPFNGGPPWLSMHGGSCLNCHGRLDRGDCPDDVPHPDSARALQGIDRLRAAPRRGVLCGKRPQAQPLWTR